MTPLLSAFAVVVLLCAGNAVKAWILSHRVEQRLKSVCPGGNKIWIFPLGALQLVTAPLYPFKGTVGSFFDGFKVYAKYGSTCLSAASVWGARPTFYTTDAETAKSIVSDRHTFIKDVESYAMLEIYGPNVVSAEGSVWKRHRMISSPAFSEGNNAMVWNQTLRVMDEWFADIDTREKPEEPVDLVRELSQITLLVIASTGFGRTASWKGFSTIEDIPAPGEPLTFQPAMTKSLSRLLYKVLTPSIAFTIANAVHIPLVTPLLKETQLAYESLRFHMLEVISGARASVTDGKAKDMESALLRNLVEANMFEEGRHITDEELLSNTMVFLLAGQETTAHTTSFALSFLALYPDVQQNIYEEVNKAWPVGACPPTYKEFLTKFEYTTATLHETLRLVPAVPRFGKIVQKDTTVHAHKFQTTPQGEIVDVQQFTIPIERGSVMMVDVKGLHINPMYWGSDAEEFKPEHFIDTDTYRWPRDAFLAFSGGPRTCLGQRFATTEAVCILASLVRKYEIMVPPSLEEKSWQEQRKTMLHWYAGITSVPTGAKTVFLPRK